MLSPLIVALLLCLAGNGVMHESDGRPALVYLGTVFYLAAMLLAVFSLLWSNT